MLLDLDGFKAVNDTLGHQAGDTLLAKVGHWFGEDLSAQLGSALPDLRCGRFGGDEFVLMGRLPAGAHGDAAGALAERIIASFAARSFVTGLRLGVSVGVHSAVGQPVSAMLAAADEALYAAKEAGRNRHAVYDAALETQSFIRRDIERHLLGALQAQQIELHYQPIVAEGGGSVDGFEALLRWQHPVHSMIPPEDIVVAAAHNGLAQQLFEYVLDAALQAAVRLRSSGHGRVRVFVNAAPRDVSQFPIDTVILEALARHELPAAALGIELTGTETLDIARARSRLGHLAETGVSITADGFGVGHASLALIQSRFIGRLKIDCSFVADLGRRHDSEPVISAALGLGRALALEVVAEGVETQAQFTVLRAMGCDRMQGNHFAPPMPLDAATAWLAARRIIATARPA